ncbi:hypothetical protein [Thermotalea metallivorans]|uniref:Nucleotide-diphospho-sugar transferase domain-containing protein n=1 Tax=Thermotalea metallivorans TaxID=520762 RepID=A0A140L0H6_9FIRM|nr:hypothetical protein [Thermotalea metallivorans]KXG74051.1 hypothetical protein AN619_26610 [Thermotalea metallivorans]
MRKFHFSTVISNKYVFKSIVMYNTLERHCRDFHLYALCADEEAHRILSDMHWKNTTIVRLSEVEDGELLQAKTNRTHLEYCWTLKSAMLNYVMNRYPQAQYFAHLDADLCFFANPEVIFLEAPNAALFLTDHHNSERFLYTYNLTGRFNTGFVGCKNDPLAYTAIDWWKKRCIEWCYTENKVDAQLFGDQRYVERWPALFHNVHVVQNIGVNVALWNIEKYQVSLRNGEVYINDNKLVFYHFSGFSIYNAKEFNLSWFYILPHAAVEYIYMPYMRLLSQTIETVQRRYPHFSHGFVQKGEVPDIHYFRI